MLAERSLPVAIEPIEGESGAGYCLRLAARNGLSLVQLRTLIGISAGSSFKREHVFKLAWLSKVDPVKLEPCFPTSLRGVRTGVSFLGQSLRLRAYHRGRQPQVCPVCIERYRYCRSEWDFTLSCACLEHSCPLIDRCPTCGKPLRWDRPTIEWSSCRHYLGRPFPEGESFDPVLSEMQTVIGALVADTEIPSVSFPLPFSGRVSLDGWFSLVWAFGVMTAPHQVLQPGTLSSVPSSEAVGVLIRRARERMAAYTRGAKPPCAELRALIAEAPLLGVIRDSHEENNRRAAMTVYRFVAGEKALEAALRKYRLSTQLSLFE